MSEALKVEKRETRPRSLRNELRKAGKIPAIVYGYQVENTPVAIEEKELSRILRENGANVVLSFDLNGKPVNALLSEPQFDTFNRAIKHVELIAVNMKEEVEVDAELQLVGEEAVLKTGAEIGQVLYSVKVSATPDKLPEFVTVDISELRIGDSLTVADLPKFADFKVVTDPEEHILSVVEKQEVPEEDEEEATVVVETPEA
ncbi:50S ribosomal protein L25/general stress protein Ctc [Enterococcus timonensis]|uniref:50S ribosomal protein L25/general stress protein Ctc n=1 Tax=Enterococcus timonensis TaxID=1852364 RepID=UPI0008D9ED86|nr:50S ribosomal protein L25/general stress protein Ctc [Enterococcus timonensis]